MNTLNRPELHQYCNMGKTKAVIAVVLLHFLVACSTVLPDSESRGNVLSRASPPKYGPSHSDLVSLPDPAGKISVAVYSFGDLTGQNKPSPSSGFSKMVTQGGLYFLIKSLIDSKWFTPVTRGGLNNLLTERKIWETKLNANNRGLPALPNANVILEGGIVAYDSNIRTGGKGAKYLGIGGSSTYREDIVTVNLSLVNPIDGVILHSVNSTKVIYSDSKNRSIFGFVDHDQILELEGGYGQNEPVQLAVVEAIDAAILELIVDGILGDTWSIRDPAEIRDSSFSNFIDSEQIANYLKRKGVVEDIEQEIAPDLEEDADPDVRPRSNVETSNSRDSR